MYIWKELTQHKLAYAMLVLILLTASAAFMWWAETLAQKQQVIGALTLGYFCWGVSTHVKSAVLTRYVILEYAAIAVLGGLLLLLLTF